jgi:methylenetetrahydrofolate reductase (NADPH)
MTKAVDLLKPRDSKDIIEKLKDSTETFHIYTFGGLKETNQWLMENNYA